MPPVTPRWSYLLLLRPLLLWLPNLLNDSHMPFIWHFLWRLVCLAQTFPI
jgi:hypothetical protein